MNVFLNWYSLVKLWVGPHVAEVSQLRSVLGFHLSVTKNFKWLQLYLCTRRSFVHVWHWAVLSVNNMIADNRWKAEIFALSVVTGWEDSYSLDGSRGDCLQEIHLSQRRVELRYCHVGGDVIRREAVLGDVKSRCKFDGMLLWKSWCECWMYLIILFQNTHTTIQPLSGIICFTFRVVHSKKAGLYNSHEISRTTISPQVSPSSCSGPFLGIVSYSLSAGRVCLCGILHMV